MMVCSILAIWLYPETDRSLWFNTNPDQEMASAALFSMTCSGIERRLTRSLMFLPNICITSVWVAASSTVVPVGWESRPNRLGCFLATSFRPIFRAMVGMKIIYRSHTFHSKMRQLGEYVSRWCVWLFVFFLITEQTRMQWELLFTQFCSFDKFVLPPSDPREVCRARPTITLPFRWLVQLWACEFGAYSPAT